MHHSPRWQPAKKIPRSRIPKTFRDWLLDPSSLTHRMKQACPENFRVRVLEQEWNRPRQDETRLLGLRSGARGLIRQVQLLCNEVPCVFARTVIPITTLTGKQRQLAHLGSRPLGAFLFADNSMRRGPVEVCEIQAGQDLYLHAALGIRRPPPVIWGRRSVFYLDKKPLLVSEIFLNPPAQCCKRWPFTP